VALFDQVGDTVPLYEYRCEKCNTITDIHHGFDDKNTETCPKCGGPLARSFNASSIVFKGSGFYVNDSRTSGGSGGDSGNSTPSAT
jgi:putative FmdB family regulatory protein